jgi:hypothetical protein
VKFLGPIVALLVSAACGPPQQCELSIGTAGAGGVGFATMPLTATLVPGAQGGFHVWLGYRVKDGDGTLTASHEVRRVRDGQLLSRGQRRLVLDGAASDGWWQSDMATPAFLCPTPLGVSVIDETATFEVKLLDSTGAELARDSVTTKLSCPTDAQADFCARVCAG